MENDAAEEATESQKEKNQKPPKHHFLGFTLHIIPLCADTYLAEVQNCLQFSFSVCEWLPCTVIFLYYCTMVWVHVIYLCVCMRACLCVCVKKSKDFVSKGHGHWPEECHLYSDLI